MTVFTLFNYQKKIKFFFKIKTFLLPLLSCFLITSCNNNDDDTGDTITSSTLSNKINNRNYVNILENRLSNLPKNSQVAIALVHEGNTEYLGAINDNGVLQAINNQDNVFEIGSITKVFTSICLSDLIAEKEASLTETLKNQFDFSLQEGEDITFEQLANHTSGLPRLPTNVDEVKEYNPNDPYAVYSYNNLKSYLQNHVVLNAASGANYEYSNLGSGILGYALAKKRNTTFEELLQGTIFNPIGMTNTTTLLENVDVSKLVEGRDLSGSIVSHWNFAETMSAAGSIKSSVTDMVKFIRKNFEEDVVYNLPQTKTFDKGNNSFMGLGWSIIEDNQFTIHAHDGGTGGFSSMLMLDKRKKIGVIVLSNTAEYHNRIIPMCNDFILEINK